MENPKQNRQGRQTPNITGKEDKQYHTNSTTVSKFNTLIEFLSENPKDSTGTCFVAKDSGFVCWSRNGLKLIDLFGGNATISSEVMQRIEGFSRVVSKSVVM